MSRVNTMKDRVIEKLNTVDSIQKVYSGQKTQPEGWPCAFVTTSDLEGTFVSSAENSRTFGFNIMLAMPVGSDFVPESERERLDYSERVLNDAMEDIIQAFDQDIELGNDPILFLEAADCQWGWANFESGEAQALQITLKIYSEVVVT